MYENEGRECIDETTMGELDESSLQQIENILSLDNNMETEQGNYRNIFKYILRSFPIHYNDSVIKPWYYVRNKNCEKFVRFGTFCSRFSAEC